jgi:hypothetical protein
MCVLCVVLCVCVCVCVCVRVCIYICLFLLKQNNKNTNNNKHPAIFANLSLSHGGALPFETEGPWGVWGRVCKKQQHIYVLF